MLKSTFGEIAMKSRQRQKDILFSLIVFFSAFTVNLLIQKLFTTQTLVPMIFVFGVFLISLKTHGYCYGITSAIVSVFAVNFAFTYPYYAFDFFVEESIQYAEYSQPRSGKSALRKRKGKNARQSAAGDLP